MKDACYEAVLVSLLILLYPVSAADEVSEAPAPPPEPTVAEVLYGSEQSAATTEQPAPEQTAVTEQPPQTDAAPATTEPAKTTGTTLQPESDSSSQQMLMSSDEDDKSVQPWMIKPATGAASLNVKDSYQTSLFTGSFSYSYPFEVPPGTNGLTPSITLSYNSQGASGSSGMVGLGWSLTENYIQRVVNGTPDDASNHKFRLLLNGESNDLVWSPSEGRYHTKLETYLYITNVSGSGENSKGTYWLVKSKDGTEFRFGYTADSEKMSNIYGYAVRWSLDQVKDTSGNKIYYGYSEDPFSSENGTVYPRNITYNNDRKRAVYFVLEDGSKPDWRSGFQDGLFVKETRRLKEINVVADSALIRRYLLQYGTSNGTRRSLLANISVFGNDNSTALPPTRFDYQSPQLFWANDSAHVWNAPRDYTYSDVSDNGCRLMDVNGDGLQDMLCVSDNRGWNYCYLNNGSGFVEAEWCRLPDTTWSLYFGTIKVVDLNGDGFPDISNADEATETRRTLLSNGTAWYQDTSGNWLSPPFFNYYCYSCGQSYVDNGCAFFDVNLDGLQDLLCNRGWGGDVRACYLNNGSKFIQTEWCRPPINFPFDDSSTKIEDLNGDGYTDLSYSYSSNSESWRATVLGNGSGWVNDTAQIWFAPIPYNHMSPFGSRDGGARFTDVNGDGLPDILKSNQWTSEVSCWVNNGSGFKSEKWCEPTREWSFEYDTPRIQFTDVDGDSIVDQSYSSYGSWRATQLSTAAGIDLLISVNNSLGGQIQVRYNSSVRFNNTGNDGIGDLNTPVYVVTSVAEDNGLAGGHSLKTTTNYTYYGGVYTHERINSEFRGFNLVNVTRSDSSVVSHWFHQDVGRKGREYKTEARNKTGNLFTATETNYSIEETNGAYVVLPYKTTERDYDGLASFREKSAEYAYDIYGNANKTAYKGEIGVNGDERTEFTEYVVNSSAWVVDRLMKKTVYDAGMSKISETKYGYDNLPYGSPPIKGLPTWTQQWLSGGDSPSFAYGYDGYGNRVNATDPRGGVTKFTYGLRDTTYTYPDQVINPLGQTSDVNYLLSTGNMNYTTDPNSYKTLYNYDIFGRLSSVVKEGDSAALPSVEYAYFIDGVAPEGVRTKARINTGASATFDSVSFVDGFGRQIQSRVDAEPVGKQVVSNRFYDLLGRASAESIPYFASYGNYSGPDITVRNVSHQYDAQDREIKTVNTDNTYRTILYRLWNVTFTDENGHSRIQSKDAYDRISDVYELNGGETYRTRYTYDGLDNLVNILDNLGNIFRFEYDSLKRMTGLRDPDLGNWTYGFDASNNLVNQTDARGKLIKFEYDLLNRPTKKDYPSDTDVVMTYDTGKIGTLFQADSASGTVKYEYDSRLRQTAENYTRGGTLYWTRQSYDNMDRVVNKTFSSGNTLQYTFNAGGMLESVPGYVSSLDYSALGKVANRTYNNSLASKLAYFDDSFRLKTVQTGGLQGLAYKYDGVGNVLQMNDTVNGSFWGFGYDALDRVVVADELVSVTELVEGAVYRDNWLNSYYKTSNYEGVSLSLGTYGASGARKYRVVGGLRMPGGSGAVEGVVLSLYCNGTYGYPAYTTNNYTLYRLVRGFNETGSTWVKNDSATNWSVQGGDYDSSVVDYVTVGSTCMGNNRWVNFTLMGDGAVNPVSLNWTDSLDFLVREDSEDAASYRYETFSSRTGSNPPRLYVTYKTPMAALHQNYTYNSIGNILRVFDGVGFVNYTYGAGAGPHAVSSTFGYSNISYGYESYSVTSSCTGVYPAQGSNWTITSNTSCVGGRVRLDTNKSVTVTANKSLYMDNANLEANQYPGVFVWLEPGSVLELDNASTAYINDAPSASYPGNLTTQYLYDLNGNMVNDSRYVYEYNEDSRMKRVLNQSGAIKEEYVYDHGGNRKVKLTVLNQSLNKTTLYLGQDWLREEYTNGTVDNTLYIYANNEMLARKDAAGNKYYYHPDHLGSTVVVTKQDGSLQERIQYEPYGLPRETSKELYQFTNQEWSGDLGIYDYGARQYNPVLKRFMQADTTVKNYYSPQLLNRYNYVGNNPIVYVDPDGHIAFNIGYGRSAAVGLAAAKTSGVVFTVDNHELFYHHNFDVRLANYNSIDKGVGTPSGSFNLELGITAGANKPSDLAGNSVKASIDESLNPSGIGPSIGPQFSVPVDNIHNLNDLSNPDVIGSNLNNFQGGVNICLGANPPGGAASGSVTYTSTEVTDEVTGEEVVNFAQQSMKNYIDTFNFILGKKESDSTTDISEKTKKTKVGRTKGGTG